ncbi:MAG: hypothetical protein J6Q92_00410 [Oscillospiraceae bacterium]|nr:hypothetical protein [Oscillospiraceae bacterium]
MEQILKRISIILLISALLFCTGCAQQPKIEETHKAQEPPGNAAMVDLIGKTKDQVLTTLSLKETDLTEHSLYVYKTPLEITYQDVKMHVLLEFVPIEEDGEDMCDGIWYLAQYQGEPERAAKEMLAVAKEIQAAFGTPDVGGKNVGGKQPPAWEMTESELSADITKGDMSKSYAWYIEQPVSDHMKDYINKKAQRPEYIQNQVPYEPGYQCELTLTAFTPEGGDTVSAYIHLRYQIGAVK